MAVNRNRGLRKTRGPKPPKPYNPLAPSYRNQGQINKAANNQAMSQLQPELDANTSAANTANAASATRQKELQGWYSWGGDRLKDAFSKAQTAANNLIATRNAGSVDEQNSLAAALGGVGDQTSALATQVGGAAAPSQDAQLLAAALASSRAGNQAAFDTTTAQTLGQGSRVGDNVDMGIEQGAKEDARLRGVLKQGTDDRNAIMARLPGLTETARTSIEANEAQKAQTFGQLKLAKQQFGESKANRLFQQWLATKKLGLESQDQSFQHWLSTQNLHLQQQNQADTSAINWANVGINRKQADAALAQIKQTAKDAKNGDGQKKAQLRAQQFQNGLSLLSGYMDSADGEGPPGVNVLDAQGNPIVDPNTGKPKYGNATRNYQQRDYSQALRILMGEAGMSKSDAIRLLKASDNPAWRRHATYASNRLKRRSKLKKQGKKDDTLSYGQSNAVTGAVNPFG